MYSTTEQSTPKILIAFVKLYPSFTLPLRIILNNRNVNAAYRIGRGSISNINNLNQNDKIT